MTEAEMIQRCRRREREAQRVLYAQTSERIYRLLLRMTRSPDDAFDLSQNTYVLAFERIDQFDESGSLPAWLYRIAVNEALQFLRRSRKVRQHLESIAKDNRPIETQDAATSRLDVEGALARLDPKDRAILLLRYQEGLSYREIAESMDLASGTVASRLNRARRKIREILGKGYESAEETADATHQGSGKPCPKSA